MLSSNLEKTKGENNNDASLQGHANHVPQLADYFTPSVSNPTDYKHCAKTLLMCVIHWNFSSIIWAKRQQKTKNKSPISGWLGGSSITENSINEHHWARTAFLQFINTAQYPFYNNMLQYPLAANNLFKLRNGRTDPGVIESIVKYTKTDRVRIGKKSGRRLKIWRKTKRENPEIFPALGATTPRKSPIKKPISSRPQKLSKPREPKP